MNNREWFKNAKYGMMVHFGLYSMLGGEWKGKRTNNYAEWIQSYFAIPNKEYEKLAEAFNPIMFNADEWVGLAKECGMEYFVITAKHHDGFALFKSEVDKFNIADATPFGRDLIAEVAESCRKHGIKLGIYYSQELDWHHPHGGGYTNTEEPAGVSWDNSWDFPDIEKKDFSICFEEKIKPQVKELLTNYGDICLIWFDTPDTITSEQSLELNHLVKAYQPNCLINSRIGNGAYDYVSLGDNEVPEKEPPKEVIEGSLNALNGYKYSPYGLYETAGTLNRSWGYKYYDHNWKSVEKIAANKKHLNSMGINYLLNVGPDALGRIPSISVDILREASKIK